MTFHPDVLAPEKIWLSAIDDDNEREIWTDPDEGGTEYTRSDIADRQNAELQAELDANPRWKPKAEEPAVKLVAAEAENARLKALPLKDEVERVLNKARQFIENGVEFGYIRLPDAPDPALDTLPAILALLSRLRAGGQEEWQPIETAPKDGTPVWALLNDSGIRLIHWVSPEKSAEELGGDPSEYDGIWAEVGDHSEQWEPDFWSPQDAFPASPSVSEGGSRNG